MTKIKEFTIRNLLNGEDFGYQKRIEVETIHLSLESDKEMVQTYKNALLDYDKALKNSNRNSHTVEVVSVDNHTNIAWRGLHAQIKVMLNHPNETYRKTATECYNILNKYGNITKMGYNEKYGYAFNLLQDFTALGWDKRNQMNIDDWVVELQTRYDEYVVSTTARTEEDSHQVTGIIKDMREKADRAYRALMERVNALSLINGEEEYRAFITNVNVIIDEAHAVLAARKTRAKHDKEQKDAKEVKA